MPVSNDPYCCDFHREQDCPCLVEPFADMCLCDPTAEECLCDACEHEEEGNSYLADLLDEIKMEEKRNA